jgi:hypothetical protein
MATTLETVTGYIQAILQRDPVAGEAESYAAWVDGPAHRPFTDVVNSLIASPEAQSDVVPVIRTYQAVYGRVPDAGGLDYWVDVFRALKVSTPDDPNTTTVNEPLVELLKTFVDPAHTPEFAALYGSNPTGAAYIQSLYLNVLNRDPDAGGLAYWTSVYNTVANEHKGDDGVLSAAEAVTVRAILLEQFVSSAEYTSAVADEAATFLSNSATGVPMDPSTKLWALDPTNTGGQTFTLTENVETVNGTAADNTFNATLKFVGAAGQLQTLQSGDVVNGGDGNDTLNADIWNIITVPTITGVETLNISDYAGVTLNLSNSTGVNTVNYKLLAGNTTLDSVGSVVALGAANVSGDRDITVNYLATALTGANTQKISVAGTDLNDVFLTSNDPVNAGIETVEINVGAGSSTIDGLSGTAINTHLNKVVIAGSGNLEANLIGNSFGAVTATKLAVVDASAAEGNLKLNVGVALDQTITGGKGNDEFYFQNTLTKDDTVNGGDGVDSIIAVGDLNAASYKIAAVENITLVMDQSDAGNTNTLNAAAFGGGIQTVTIRQEAALTTNADDATINGLAAGVKVVVEDNALDAVGDGTVDDITVNGANVAGTSDAITVSLNAQRSAFDLVVDDLAVAGYETVTIESTGAAAANANIENIITNGITDAALKTLNVTGTRELILGGNLTAKTIDASAMTGGGVTLGLGAAEQTVTLSKFNDTLSINPANLTDKDTIKGGEGTDTLNFLATGNFAGTANAKNLSGVTGFEKIGLGANGVGLTLDDASLAAFTDAKVNITVTGDFNGTSVDVTGVKNSNAYVNVDTTKVTSAANGHAFTIGNGHDTLDGGAGIDAVVIADEAYIASTDTLKGGTGNNNLLVFADQGAAATNTFGATQFGGVSGFDTWRIDDGANAETFDITLSDAVAAANANSTTSVLTISVADSNASGTIIDTLKLDASAVGAGVSLVVTGGDVADTIKAGAGDDTITGGLGADKITTGAGKDTVVLKDVATADTVTDFNFGNAAGKSDANIDKFDTSALTAAASFASGDFDTVQTITAAATALGADADVIILAHQAFADASAVDAYLEANNAGNKDSDVLVVYQDTLGQVRIAFGDGDGGGAESGGADFTTDDIAILTGVNLAGVKDIIDTGDFIV